ncbi:MAG: Crp/Fnr family transcriptional regulator [Thermonemataceae bacterium]
MAGEKEIWFFDDVNLYNILCPHRVKDAKKREQHKFYDFKKDEFIYFEDDPADKIFLIANGRVKIGSYSEEGDEFIKAILTRGELFGERSLLGEGKRSDFAQALDNNTTVCPMTIDDMQDLMLNNKPLSFKINKIIYFRFKKLERRLELLIFKDVRTRLVEFLKDVTKEKGKMMGHEVFVENFLTHKDIAQLIGSSRQTVTTLLNELEQEGVLRFQRKNFFVKQEELAAL